MGTQEKGTSSYKMNCGLFIMSLSINTRKQAANNLPVKSHCVCGINYPSLLIKKKFMNPLALALLLHF